MTDPPPAAAPAARPGNGPVGLILLLAAVLFVDLRVRAVHVPLERDEGEYAYIAQRMLAGDVPYRDVFDQKPPGVFFVYLVPVALFGTSVAAIHMTLYAFTAATAYFLFRIARELGGATAAAWAVLVFALITIEPAWLATAANTEQFMLLPMTAAVWWALRAMRGGGRGWWVAAGAASMAACWFKQVAATQIGFIALLAAWQAWRGRRPIRAIALDAGGFAVGMAAAFSPVAAYFVLNGAWHEFVDCVWTHNVKYSALVPWEVGRELLMGQISAQAGRLWLVALLAATAALSWTRRWRESAAFYAGWLVFSAAGVSIGFYFREHYFVQLAPALAAASGATVARMLSPLWNAPRPARVAGVFAAACLVAAPTLYANRDFFYRSTPAEQSRLVYGLNPFAENDALAELIARLTGPDDRVLIFGSEPQLHFQARRRAATRYIFFYPLMMDLPLVEERQREALREIEQADPRCIVITNNQASLLINPRTPMLLQEGVGRMLERRYRLAGLREMTPLGVRIVGDPAEAARVLEAARRDPQHLRADMLIFVRD